MKAVVFEDEMRATARQVIYRQIAFSKRRATS
jgi:hypothetical protein